MDNDYLALLKDHHQSKLKKNDQVLLSESSIDENLNEAGVSGNIAAIIAFGYGGWGLWRAIRAATDKASKKCGIFKISEKRDACILRVRIEDCDRKIKFIKNRKNKDCKDKRDPDKCRKTVKKLIEKEEGKKKEYKQKLEKLRKEGRG